MFKNLKQDIKRYWTNPKDPKNLYLIFEPGLWSLFAYRFSAWAHHIKIPVINWVFRAVAFIAAKAIEAVTHISIPGNVKIGPGLYIGHGGPIIINYDARLGSHCSVGTGVIIGTRGVGNVGSPTIGDHVYIGVGAKILGKITIGSHVKIGANAVVIKDVPDGATAVGVPARVIQRESKG
ncbi:MAG: serine acetyltransferase [Candidatus Omnitrophica bacterium]|nr:serine acetyltransferase [Candidatus Omnitrophota bacterium]